MGIPEWTLFTRFLIIIMYLSGTGQDSEHTVMKSQRLLLLWWACTPQEAEGATVGLYSTNELERVLPPGNPRAPAFSGDLDWSSVPSPSPHTCAEIDNAYNHYQWPWDQKKHRIKKFRLWKGQGTNQV